MSIVSKNDPEASGRDCPDFDKLDPTTRAEYEAWLDTLQRDDPSPEPWTSPSTMGEQASTSPQPIADLDNYWKFLFGHGIAPHLPTAGLEALRAALVNNDPRLIAGATTSPPPLNCVKDWPVEGACPIGYCFAFATDTPKTVGEVEEHFARVCGEADKALGETAACRWLLNWWDSTPREVTRPLLLAEVEVELSRRRSAGVVTLAA